MALRGNVLESCQHLSDFITGVRLSGTERRDARFQATHTCIWKKYEKFITKLN